MGKTHSRSTVGTVDDGYCYLTDVSPKDKPWDIHRANTEKISDLYVKVGYEEYASRTHSCSQRLEFALRTDEKGERLLKLLAARFCRVRHCSICQWRRSLMWRARFFQVIPRLLEDYSSCKFIFLTLTVKNCQLDELRQNLTWMNQSWRRMVKRKIFPAIGFVRSVEVTRSEDGLAHPHFHAILIVEPSYFKGQNYLSQKKWTELWKSCLRIDYTPIVNVKAVKSRKDSSKNELTDGLFIALCETLKYSVKESDLLFDENWLKGLTQQLHKTRAVSVGGVFKQYLSESEPEDLINFGLEDNQTEETDPKFWFGWKEMVKRYQSL